MGVTKTSALGLPDLRKRMAGVTSPAFKIRMSQNLAEEARTQTSNGFQKQRDPYGKAWSPLKYRKGMALQLTGRMAASVSTLAHERGFRIDIPVTYAAPHQYGARAHARKGGAIPQGKRGRFISRRQAASAKSRAQRVAIFGGFTHGGIPQRQMIPMSSTGGLGPVWTRAFNEAAGTLLDRYARGAA